MPVNRVHRLRRRPQGDLRDGDLEFVEEPIPDLEDGQALVRTLLLSLDPTNRIWMSDMRGYMPPVPIDDVMRGIGIGEVVESRCAELPVGAIVNGFTGWQDHFIADAEAGLTVLPDPLPGPMEAFLGALGHTGITAWIGLELIGKPQPGETVVINAAGGAVGSIACQLAKARGARVVGIAGGPEKCAHVIERFGVDACVDHRSPHWRDELDAATPDGIDVDFENVGGELMDHVLGRLNIGARIALCGMISQYNAAGAEERLHGLVNIPQLIMQRATITGFLVLDHADKFEAAITELATLLAEGKLQYDETVVDGLENAPTALGQLFDGSNKGKLLIRVAERSATPAAAAATAEVAP